MGHFLYGVKRVRRFVKAHLHCIVSNLKMISKMSTLLPLEKFLRTRMSEPYALTPIYGTNTPGDPVFFTVRD